MNFTKSRLGILSFALVLAGTMPAAAQQDQTMQYSGSAEQAQPQAQEFSEAQIDAYADSALEITKIHNEMAPQIQAAQTEAEKNQMFVEMQKEMVSAVEAAEDISVEEYNAISQAAQQNPQLANRIRTEVEARLQ